MLSLASEETITAAFNVDETPTTSVVIDKMFLNSKEVNCPIVKYQLIDSSNLEPYDDGKDNSIFSIQTIQAFLDAET